MRPAAGEPPSSGDREPCPFSTSKLYIRRGKEKKRMLRLRIRWFLMMIHVVGVRKD